jgi:RimJ/RimL family protein N-acetyltransferase
MSLKIIYGQEKYFSSFYQTLDAVAKEHIHLEMVEAPPLEVVSTFQKTLIEKNWPLFYAVENEAVVGWVDISPFTNPRFAHRGTLGMGLAKAARGKGLGKQLLQTALLHAKTIGIEKVELTVYPNNQPAKRLYENCGFKESGVIKHYRKWNNQYFDVIQMELFF